MSTDEDVEESEPDYRFTLANERTFLAWLRTALAPDRVVMEPHVFRCTRQRRAATGA
jgi:uncharacterized membrane protein YidH (DUF202 family)